MSHTVNTKKFFLWILRLGISVGITYYLFTRISFSEIIAGVASANLSYILIAFLIFLLACFIAAFRLKFLTDRQGMTLSVLKILGINLSAIFYGLFLPGGNFTGGLIRWHKLSKTDSKPAEAVASVVFDRMIDTITICILGIAFWVFDKPSDQRFVGLSFGTVLGGICLIFILILTGAILIPSKKGANSFWVTLIPNIALVKANKLIISLSRFTDLPRGYFALVIALSFAFHLFGIFASYLLSFSLSLNISFTTIGWIRSVVLILGVLPISISGFGVREGALVFLLRPYGVSLPDAIALSLLFFVSRLWIGAIGGVLEAKNFLWRDGGELNQK